MRKLAVWASLVANILLVITGGVVRLTASGLGCPTWPTCTGSSMVPVPAAGIHGLIENTNRGLTIVLVLVAIFTAWQFWKTAQRWLSVALLAGIPAQAVLGGISVLTNLNPWVVGGHFVLSAVLIAIATRLVWAFYDKQAALVSGIDRAISIALTIVGSITVLIGIAVTGAGPHAGDAKSPRNGLDLSVVEHLHSYPAYLTLVLAVIAFFRLRKEPRLVLINLGLVATLLFQAAVGVAQARLGVPALLVGYHLAGAAILCSLIWAQLFSTKRK